MLAYFGFAYLAVSNDEKMKYHYAMSRIVSRMTGRLCNMPLPPYLRGFLYQGFGALYGVRYDELPEGTDLNQFRTFNAFFTREIDLAKRPVADKANANCLTSPCDGRVLSFGEVKSGQNLIECVKGQDYPLEEFLFGFVSTQDEVKSPDSMINRICNSAKDRGNKLNYVVLYLAPQDYHRFHSPADFVVNYRRHIAGWLEPVMPSYLAKHKHVLKENERVNLLGSWKHGFMAYSAIGALNVGSIVISFDELVHTNVKHPKIPYLDDRNYELMKQDSNKNVF